MFHQLSVEAIDRGQVTARVGRRILVLAETGSTNAYALDEIGAKQGPVSDGTVIFAEYQTAGRGRLGRTWDAPRGSSLTFTVLLWEEPTGFSAARLIMSAALAVVKGVESSTDVAPLIRWPNDVFVGTRKLAGILVEARACGEQLMPVAVGIGVNCLQQPGHFTPELRPRATSLEIESRVPVDRAEVARAILRELDRWLNGDQRPDDAVLAANWREHVADMGRRVTIQYDGETITGQVLDVNPQTGLLLQLDHGVRREFDLATVTRREPS